MYLTSEIFILDKIFLKGILLLLFSALFNTSSAFAHRPGAPDAGWFTENRGQWHQAVKYRIQLDGTTVFLEEGGLMLVFQDQEALKNLFRFKYNPKTHCFKHLDFLSLAYALANSNQSPQIAQRLGALENGLEVH